MLIVGRVLSSLGHPPVYPLSLSLCTGQVSGDLRLVGGTNSSSGRLEIYYSGVWGTICDDGFSGTEALVACRQLEFSSYVRVGNVDDLGYVTVKILMCNFVYVFNVCL